MKKIVLLTLLLGNTAFAYDPEPQVVPSWRHTAFKVALEKITIESEKIPGLEGMCKLTSRNSGKVLNTGIKGCGEIKKPSEYTNNIHVDVGTNYDILDYDATGRLFASWRYRNSSGKVRELRDAFESAQRITFMVPWVDDYNDNIQVMCKFEDKWETFEILLKGKVYENKLIPQGCAVRNPKGGYASGLIE